VKTKELIKEIKDYQEQGTMGVCDFFKNDSFKIEDADDSKHTILFVASDETVDRVNERLIAKGCNVKNYNKTGKPFLWCHNRRIDNPPIGRGVWAKVIDNELKILTEFYVDKGNAWSDFCKTIYEMYRDDFMESVSVGYIPDARREPTDEEKQEFPKLSLITDKWELLEHSAVPVPANPNAVQQKILDEKMQEVKEAMQSERILIPSICLEDFGFEEEKKEGPELIGEIEALEKMGLIEIEEMPMEEAEAKPYENEHSCRLEDPKQFKRFARVNCDEKHNGKCIDIIYGFPEGKEIPKPEGNNLTGKECKKAGGKIQALRYKTSIWTKEAAQSHCKSREGSFEPAKEKDYDLIAVYDGSTGEEIGVAKIPKEEVIETEETPAIRITRKKTGVIVKDSKENPENSEKSEGLSLTEEQIELLQKNICSKVKKEMVDSFLGEFRRKLGIVDENKL
jgi:hypothetical protein